MIRTLSQEDRNAILDKISSTVTQHFYDPELRGIDWAATVERHRETIAKAVTPEQFERAVGGLLAELKTSHLGFYHRRLERATSKMALSATYSAFGTDHGDCWVFQDVHEGGAAHNAGVRSGDTLLAVDGRSFLPPDHPVFATGKTVKLTVRTADGKEETRSVDIPSPRKRKHQLPYVQPKLVISKRLNADLGYIKISMYPGVVGIEVANLISGAVASINPMRGLILDLRGNTGGGIAVLRVMSLLTPKKLPVGYSRSRKYSKEQHHKDRFPVFDRIPSTKLGLLPLLLKFARPSKPIMLMTEGLGTQPFHGRVALIVNRHTASANEMLIAFAREYGLAKIVGEATPGHLLSGSKFKVGRDYCLALPVGAYYTAAGRVLEGTPIQPDVEVPFDPALAREGKDSQLQKAIETLSCAV